MALYMAIEDIIMMEHNRLLCLLCSWIKCSISVIFLSVQDKEQINLCCLFVEMQESHVTHYLFIEF